MEFTHFVGIDIAKSKFDIEHLDKNGRSCARQFSNDISGISKLILHLESYGIGPSNALICMEHTGHYIDQITRILYGEGFFVWVVSPLFLKEFSPRKLRLENDDVAAHKIRLYAGYFHELAEQFIPDDPLDDELKKIFRRRNQLIRMRTSMYNMRTSNKDLATPDPDAEELWTRHIESFDQDIKKADKLLKKRLTSTPRYRRKYDLLLSIPGIGPVCATQLLILTKGFTKFKDFRSFACYISTAPFEKSSGKRYRKPRIHKAGRKDIKSNLFLGALRHIRTGGFFHDYYKHRTEEKNKHHNSVMNALINKLLKIVFDMIRLDQHFDLDKYLEGKRKSPRNLGLS